MIMANHPFPKASHGQVNEYCRGTVSLGLNHLRFSSCTNLCSSEVASICRYV
jgi:hypothetical protein